MCKEYFSKLITFLNLIKDVIEIENKNLKWTGVIRRKLMKLTHFVQTFAMATPVSNFFQVQQSSKKCKFIEIYSILLSDTSFLLLL